MYNYFLKIALYSTALNIILTPLNDIFARIFGYISIFAFWLYPVLNRREYKKIPPIIIGFIFVIFLSIITSFKVFDLSVFRPRLIAVFSFIAFYISLLCDEKEESKLFDFKDILIVSYVLAFVFITYTFGNFSFKYRVINEYGGIQFTMGLGNPNAISVYVLFVCMMLIINSLTTKSRKRKLLNCVLICFMTYILFLLTSRTVLLCLFIALFALLFKKKKKANTIISGIMITIPIAVIPFLLYQNTKLSSLKLLGKAVDTGRFEIYSNFLKELKSNPLQYIFGNFDKYAFHNLHNGPISIIASLGIIGFILYMIFWLKEINNITKNMRSRYQIIAYVFILLFLMNSATEAMSVIGTIPYSIFVLLVVKIAKGQVKIGNVSIKEKS